MAQVQAQPDGRQLNGAPIPVVLQLDAAPCLDAAAIREEVARRSPRIEFTADTPPGAPPRRAQVLGAHQVNGGEVGATLVLDGVEPPVRRELWARDCGELVRAVGFVVSVTFDPPAPPPRSLPQEEPSATPEASTAVTPVAERPQLPRLWRIGPGLGARAVVGLAPTPIWGVVAVVDVLLPNPTSLGALFRVEGSLGASEVYKSPAGSAVFRSYTVGLHACPVWTPGAGAWQLSVCGVGRGGVFAAQGRATLDARHVQRRWFEVGGNALLRFGLSPNWFLNAQVGGSKPLTPFAFQFDPIVFHRVSPWILDVGIFATTAW
jgi:hypothetical protein